MIQRVKNHLQITCTQVDFTTSTNIEFYLRQGDVFKSYTPTVVSANVMNVVIPKTDMLLMENTYAQLQFALTDVYSNSIISEIVIVPVSELMKEAGYGN